MCRTLRCQGHGHCRRSHCARSHTIAQSNGEEEIGVKDAPVREQSPAGQVDCFPEFMVALRTASAGHSWHAGRMSQITPCGAKGRNAGRRQATAANRHSPLLFEKSPFATSTRDYHQLV